MRGPVRAVTFVACAWLLGAERPASAAPADPPAGLPQYRLALDVRPAESVVHFRQTVTWTNRRGGPTDVILFNFYPHYQIPDGEEFLLAKTLELLRMNPRSGIDRKGRHGTVDRILLHKPGGKDPTPVAYSYRTENATTLRVDLPFRVEKGQSVTLELTGSVTLPPKQGRWGQWDGVSYFTNALPLVAYHDAEGWHDTPFVPWHQPFWNEAGVYTGTVTLPADHSLACSASVKSETVGQGTKTVTIEPFVGRDFSLVCSNKFKEFRSTAKLPDGREVALKCYAFEQHDHYAKVLLDIARQAIEVYSKWLGPYPYDQFTIAESYFGWNGNELSGMILIDQRIFSMPHLLQGYVEYLAAHEVCHQWWYNVVGTNGFSETFMDEGLATYFTHRFVDQKLGKNNKFIDWPGGITWLPNIERENYRYASWYGAVRRDEAHAAAGDLPNFGHLYGLFSGAYDRGSKVFGMIENRLGEAAFLDFIRGIVKKYSFEVLTAAKFKAELEAYTGQPWDDFFQKWVYGKGLTDWSVESVSTNASSGPRAGAGGGRRVEVVVRQRGEHDEPTTVGFQFADGDGFPVRIPVGPTAHRIKLAEYEAEVEPLGDGRAVVRATLPREPVQVAVDPDKVLLDATPGDNKWKNPPRVTVTPVYSMLNETDLTTDYDRWNFTAGPWVGGALYPDPWYTRSSMLGVRAGAFRTQTFAGGAYAAVRSDYRDLVVGADGLVDHWPHPRTQVGFNVEQRVAGPWLDGGQNGDDTAFRAVLFGRYVFQYGSSMYLPPMHYLDLYTTYQDNFLPIAREQSPGAVRPDAVWLTGLHWRLNLYTPYWDPERGVWVDLFWGSGVANLDKQVGTHQVKAELAAARALPEGLGYWSDVKVAARGVVMGAAPDRGQFFALGGGTLFRGFDLAERQGSFLWVANTEIRLPVIRRSDEDVLDHTVGLRNLYVAPFYDVGEAFVNGRSVNGVAHAVGAGLRADVALFSFIERVTMRFDVGKTINAASPFQFWFGVQHPF